MFTSLNSGITGLQQFQQQMNVIGNNIANVGTTGYKQASIDFVDALSQNLDSFGSTTPVQVGTGVSSSAISSNFSQGALNQTGISSDLAVSGAGFFVVKDSDSGSEYATRDGQFKLDSQGYLTTDSGMRVQGYSDSTLSSTGDIQIDATGAPATAAAGATMTGFNIGQDGKITVTLSDGTQFVRGQVLLQNFQDPHSLVKEGGNLYSYTDSAGPLSKMADPSANGLGKIDSGALELSNVDLTSQFGDLIQAQRSFQANAQVVTTSDQVLQTIVGLKR